MGDDGVDQLAGGAKSAMQHPASLWGRWQFGAFGILRQLLFQRCDWLLFPYLCCRGLDLTQNNASSFQAGACGCRGSGACDCQRVPGRKKTGAVPERGLREGFLKKRHCRGAGKGRQGVARGGKGPLAIASKSCEKLLLAKGSVSRF